MILADKPLSALRSCRGMTLLEVMLAMFILVMVVSMVSLSLTGSLNVMEATRTQGELFYRAQIVLQRISEDLASAVLLEDIEFTGTNAEEGGQEIDSVDFSSTAHVVFDPAHGHPGMALISYAVIKDEENEGEYLLLRADELLADIETGTKGGSGKGGHLLSDRLRSVSFTYVDEKGEEHDDWNTEVDPNDPTPRKLPVSVICRLQFWVDRAADTSIEFSTRILVPAGLVNAEKS